MIARVLRGALPAVLVALLLGACGGDGAVSWRGATLEVPEGWTVFEQEETRLSLANAPLGEEADLNPGEAPQGDVVAVFLTHEEGTTPGRWRTFVEGRDGAEIESDESIELDGVPATRLVYTHLSGGQRTREMAVVVPARDVEILVQPVPGRGEEGGPEMFARHRDTVEAILDSIEWGAPVE